MNIAEQDPQGLDPQMEVIDYSINHTPLPSKVSKKRALLWLVGIVAIGSVLVFCTLMYSAKDSLPEQPLYNFKTNVTERLVLMTKLTARDKVAYNTALLEKRLYELNTLATNKGTSTPEVLARIATLSNRHTNDAINALKKDQSLNGETQITLLATLDTVARAEGMLTETFNELESVSNTVESTEDNISSALDSAVNTFVAGNATDTVQSFIAERIALVSDRVTTVAPGSRAQNLVIRRVSDTQEAIVDHKFIDAINAILRAEQAIVVDGYLFDSERGPLDGIPIEAGPIPEGN